MAINAMNGIRKMAMGMVIEGSPDEEGKGPEPRVAPSCFTTPGILVSCLLHSLALRRSGDRHNPLLPPLHGDHANARESPARKDLVRKR